MRLNSPILNYNNNINCNICASTSVNAAIAAAKCLSPPPPVSHKAYNFYGTKPIFAIAEIAASFASQQCASAPFIGSGSGLSH